MFDSWFGSQPAILTEVFCGVPQSMKANVMILPYSKQWQFIPDPLQLIIHSHPYIQHYISYTCGKALLNKLRNKHKDSDSLPAGLAPSGKQVWSICGVMTRGRSPKVI